MVDKQNEHYEKLLPLAQAYVIKIMKTDPDCFDEMNPKILEDILIAEALEHIARGHYDSSKGSESDFIRLSFDMTRSFYTMVIKPEVPGAPLYENPIANFSDNYDKFAKVAVLNNLSPFAYGKVLGDTREQVLDKMPCYIPKLMADAMIESDDYKLSLIKVSTAAPKTTKK